MKYTLLLLIMRTLFTYVTMKGSTRMQRNQLTIGRYSILTLSSDNYSDDPILYTHLTTEDAKVLFPLIKKYRFILAAIDYMFRNYL